MYNEDKICNEGEIISINQQYCQIRINPQTACESCHLKKNCSVYDFSDKIIECEINHHDYKIGEKVNVTMAQKMATVAVFYVFFLPLLVMILSLIILKLLGLNDKLAGLFSIISLLPYYLLLSKFSRKLTKDFKFKVSKAVIRGKN